MDGLLEDFPAFRQADVRFHIGLAETTGSAPLMTSVTEAQGQAETVVNRFQEQVGGVS